ncbi:MAG: sulfatase [Bryobacteraceae bacterium]|nr:sulfatase [Bryobacteraceae bacterium]
MSLEVRASGRSETDSPRVKSIALVGLICGILTGCADMLVGIMRAPESWPTAAEILPALAVASALGLTAFLMLWFGLAAPLARRFRIPQAPLLAATGAFTALAFFLLSAMVGIQASIFSLANGLTSIVAVVASGAIAHGFYVLLRSERRRRRLTSLARRAAQASPVVLIGLLAAAHWANPYRAMSWLGAAICVIAAAGCAFVLFRASSLRAVLLLGSLFAGTVLAGALSLYRQDGFLKAMPPATASANHRIPRVILISIDSLRVDAISHYNPKTPPTPHLDALASESVVFRRAYGPAAWTLPSTVSLLTGLPSFAHQVYWMTTPLPDEIPTLADMMLAAGYRTAAVVENPVLEPRLNLYHGFEEYAHFPKPWPWSVDAVGRRVLAAAAPSKYNRGGTEAVTRTADAWIRENRDSDFFLWVHYLDPHAPYSPPARFLPNVTPPPSIGTSFKDHVALVAGTRILNAEEREWVRQLYLAEVRYVDEQIGALLGSLKEQGLYEDALIVVTSDHGEEFWEHGGYQHGHSMYDEVLAVPLLMKLPGASVKGDLRTRVSTQFVMPTILELGGIRPSRSCYQAPSLAALIADHGASRIDEALLGSGACYQENLDAVIFRNFKLIRRLDTNREELYNLDADPDERHSLLESAPELAEVARRTLANQSEMLKRVRDCYQATDKPAPFGGRQRIEQLKSLGYLN